MAAIYLSRAMSTDYPVPPYEESRPTGQHGMWAYSPVFRRDPSATPRNYRTNKGFCCSRCISIPMSGSRSTDRNTFMRLTDTAATDWTGYQLHHTFSFNVDDRETPICDVQMVWGKAHNESKPHLGAVWRYEQHYNRGYRSSVAEFISSDEYIRGRTVLSEAKRNISDSLVADFEERHEIFVPDGLIDIYHGKERLPAFYKTEDYGVETIEELLPLSDCERFSVENILAAPYIQGVLEKIGNNALPFAVDPCGNAYIASGSDIYFYDDECDTLLRVSVLE